MLKIMTFTVAVLLLGGSFAAAETKFGVTVYPGAKYDAVRTKLMRFVDKGEKAAYRTDDGLQKVVAFYRREGLILLRLGDDSKEHARFKHPGNGMDVVVQSPWKDPKTKSLMHDTLIMIFQERE